MKRWIIGSVLLISVCFITLASIHAYDNGKSLISKIRLFSTIFERIRQDYVEETSGQTLIESAIRGMVSDLDPHTSYLTSDHFKRWNQNYEGYSGIGVSFDIIDEKINILSVFKDGPSDRVGIIPGDRIVSIDGISSVGIKRDEVPLKLMGPKGTRVKVSIERPGWKDLQDYTIVRDEVHLESIPYAFMIRPGVGYINIVRFSATTGKELNTALNRLEKNGMRALVLDLRNNGGGYLDAAVEVCDQFLPSGKRIVYTKGRVDGSFREFFATDRATHPLAPVVVLINRISASASEIVAGCLQDWDRGLILGETSFGKGLVQSQYRFPDGSALLMTTARYYTPSGRLIQRAYDDKSLEQYYKEISDDSLRKEWEVDPDRPSFQTWLLHRKVLGGGGITPDIFLKSKSDTMTTIMRKLTYSPDRLFFTFSQKLVSNNPGLGEQDFNDFLKSYRPDSMTLQAFVKYARKSNFKISNKEVIENKRDIQFVLKQFIASKLWGQEASYKVQMLRDRQLLEAIEYVDEARQLLARAYPNTDMGE
ncbi:hypothetical protein BVY01_00520 [bacterium I07]|nr:hypothetical protein BVY01_00520 [bacterium I07]